MLVSATSKSVLSEEQRSQKPQSSISILCVRVVLNETDVENNH